MRNSSATNGKIVKKQKTIIAVEINDLQGEIDFKKDCITQIEFMYSDKFPVSPKFGVIKHKSIEGFVSLLNSLEGKIEKGKAPAVLKGIYKGGTGGNFCKSNAPFLFYDIDVKNNERKKENTHLFDSKLNSDVYDYMKERSIFIFRSDSGYGMAGLLYVPYLENLLVDQKDLHKTIGNNITHELSLAIKEETGIWVDFDTSQSTFRQPRHTAVQKEKVEINESPKQIDISVSYEDEVSFYNVPAYKFTQGSTASGSIPYQYNENTRIEDVLEDCGFVNVGGNRYLHPSSSSDSTGIVNEDTNTFYSFSASFGGGLFTPFTLIAHCHNKSFSEVNEDLKKQGYQYIPINQSEVDIAVETLNNQTLGSEDIFVLCDPLKSLSVKDKHALVNRLTVDELTLNHVYKYLQFKDLRIKYKYQCTFEKYVGEVIGEIIDQLEPNSRTCILADTGCGKTTAIVKYFKDIAHTKVMFLVPLQAIAWQIESKYDIPCLTGNSDPAMHSRAKKANIVVATYEQGVKYLGDISYDYIVIDEVHNLITANSYKEEVISKLNYCLETTKSKAIGLTGTPSNIFNAIGYDLIKAESTASSKTEVIERFTSFSGYQVIISHVLQNEGKMIFRYNDKDELKDAKKELCANQGYDESEILVLEASEKVKSSYEFKTLLTENRFSDKVRIVLTTSVIDEGISIHQEGFTNIVFIDVSSDIIRPEPMTQFFARVRNKDLNRKNYLYRRNRKSNWVQNFEEREYFEQVLEGLKDNKISHHGSYSDILNNNIFYYLDTLEVNKPYLGYYITNKTFENFTPFEFDTYLEQNYNLVVTVDENYKPRNIDVAKVKASKEEKALKLCSTWLADFETIIAMLRCHSGDKEIRTKLSNESPNINEDVADFVIENLKRYERTYKNYERLTAIGVEPNEILLDKKKLRSGQSVNNKLFLLESLALIEKPRNEQEVKRKEKLLAFIESTISLKEFSKQQLIDQFLKYSPTMECSIESILLVLKERVTVTYDKRGKLYKVKN